MEISENDIFKFAPINEFTLRNLILSQLWFSPPTSMNDQLEGLIKVKNPKFSPSPESFKNFLKSTPLWDYYSWKADDIIEQNNFVDIFIENWYYSERNEYFITCFSRVPDQPLMWAHYANKHTGLCLIYDKKILMEGLKDVDKSFNYCSIDYENQPIIELFETNGTIDYRSNIPIISTKSVHWKYEDEVRIYSKRNMYLEKSGSALSIYKSALKGVIYGARMDEEDVDAVSKIIKNDPFYENIIEYNANLDYKNGGIFFTKD